MASGGVVLARLLVSINRTGLRSSDGASLLAAAPWAVHRAKFSSSSSSSGSAPPATTGIQQPLEQLISSSSTAADVATDAANAAAGSFAAAQPLEPLAQLLNPFVLGSSIWELGHSMTGLPWWASIPATTLAMRFALLPLTLKAKSAALNWVLLQNSFQTANNLLDQIKQQQQQQQGSATGAGSDKAQQALKSVAKQQQQQQQSPVEQLKRPSKLKLVRSYYRYFRKQQKTTSMWWWLANAAVQANTFVIMSVALRQMADARWPGMSDQGVGWYTDLTQPSVLLSSPIWSSLCPYGVAGTLMPLALLMVYLKTVQESPAVRSAGMKLLLDCGSLPYICLAFIQPQATLLYWAGNSVFFYGMQSALSVPKVARKLGLPSMLLPTPRGPREERERAEQEAADAHKLICGSEDDGFLRFLAANYMSRGRHQQALQCLQRLTVLAPGDSSAFSALGRTAAELQQWPTAAAAYERSAELHAAVGEVEEQATELVLSGKHWLNAVAEVRQQQKVTAAAKDKHGRSSSSSKSGSSKSSSSSSGAAEGTVDGDEEVMTWGVNVDKQQDYIDAALRVLHAAVSLPAEAVGEGRYLLAMAQAAGGQRNDALATSQQYWAAACAASPSDPAAKSNAAAKLLPVLANLCKQYHAHGEDEQLMATAALAADVAQAGWDRQSREQLHDTLGAAAQAASAGGRFTLAEQLKGLQGKLLGIRGSSSTGGSSSSLAGKGV